MRSRRAAPRRKSPLRNGRKPDPADPEPGASESLSKSAMDQFKEDYVNISWLMLLYFLQGIPLGIIGTLMLILNENGASMAQIATFGCASWPYGLKILWAPIVDAIYWPRFGRRKSWLVPVQAILGIILFVFAPWVDVWTTRGALNAWNLFLLGLFMYFLAATQDIVVDGWALTMLKNKGWAATCNTMGQSAGIIMSSTAYINAASYGWVTLPGFLRFCGVLFLVSTAAVALLKRERAEPTTGTSGGTRCSDVVSVYYDVWSVLRIRRVRELIFALLTWKFAFAYFDTAAVRRMQEMGVSKESVANMSIVTSVVGILTPMFIAKHAAGPRPMDFAMWLYLPRVALGLLGCAALLLAPGTGIQWWREDGRPGYMWVFLVLLSVKEAVGNAMFNVQMSFFSRISDESIGGTYMTLLNTCANLGWMWTSFVVMWLIDSTTSPRFDGFYVMAAVCSAVGVLWYLLMAARVSSLQDVKPDEWKVNAAARKKRDDASYSDVEMPLVGSLAGIMCARGAHER